MLDCPDIVEETCASVVNIALVHIYIYGLGRDREGERSHVWPLTTRDKNCNSKIHSENVKETI